MSIISKQTWRIEEIVRGIGYPDLIRQDLDGHFTLQLSNLFSASEEFTRGDVWYDNSADQTRYYDPFLDADVQEIGVIRAAATRDPQGYWITLPDQIGRVSQRVAVAPGEVYNLSFFAAGVSDYQGARLAVFDADSGHLICPPLTYGPQLSGDGAFVRVSSSFLVPAGCTFVRAELISDAVPFSFLSDTDSYAEYVALDPSFFLEGSETLRVGNRTITVLTSTPTER